MSERMFFLLWWQVRWIENLNLITFALAEREFVLVLPYAIVLCFVCLFCSLWYVFNNIHTFCLEVVIILFYHYLKKLSDITTSTLLQRTFYHFFQDYIDAFEKLIRLNLKDVQTREVIHVLIDCCIQVHE